MQFFLIASTKICAVLNTLNLEYWVSMGTAASSDALCPSPTASYSSSWLIVPASLDLFLVAFLISPHHSSWTATLCFTNQSVIFLLYMVLGVNGKEFFLNSPSVVVLAWQVYRRFYFHHYHPSDLFRLSVQAATFHLKKISQLGHGIVGSSLIPSHLGLHLFPPESHSGCTCCTPYVPSNRAKVFISKNI